MREVAAAASVSVGTVSNVLNAPDKVAPATVARVQAAIDKLGFVRNDAARQLKAGRSRSVGLVVLDIGNPFFTDIARAAERRAGEHNLTVLLGTSDDDATRERAYVDAFDEQRVYGLLVSPVGEDLNRLVALRERGTPVALALPGGTPIPQQSGVLVATGEAGSLNAKAVTLSSRKWGRRGNVELLRLSFGRYGDDLARSTGDEDLLAWSTRDLNTLFGITVDPVDWHIQRWIDAMPQYGPGHLDLVAELRAGLPPNLAVTGSYLDGIGVPACVGAATRAALTLVKTGVAR